MYLDLAAQPFLDRAFTTPDPGSGWRVTWPAGSGAAELVEAVVPAELCFETSGSTGAPTRWWRDRAGLWREAGILADLTREIEPRQVVAFAPAIHIWGALASVLVPARLGAPVWYRTTMMGALPPLEDESVVVIANPWVFQILQRHLPWVRRQRRLRILHSSAMLPAAAGDLLHAAGQHVDLVEVYGSTETGGLATRRWSPGPDPAWTLLDDVTFAGDAARGGDDVRLAVTHPRLAHLSGEPVPASSVTDDRVRVLGERTFELLGRRTRLVKVNGRRVNLDHVEDQLRRVVACRDLAAVPVADPIVGEHVEVLVVAATAGVPPRPDRDLLRRVIGFVPRRFTVVESIDRSPTGKLRHVRPTLPTSR